MEENIQYLHMQANVELDISHIAEIANDDKNSSIDNMLSLWLEYQKNKEEK